MSGHCLFQLGGAVGLWAANSDSDDPARFFNGVLCTATNVS